MKNLIVVVLLSFVLGLITQGCAPQTQVGVSKPTTTEPRTGGVATLADPDDPPDLDPHTSPARLTFLGGFVGSTLFNIDPETLLPVPNLVKSWEQPDPKTLVLRLNEGIRFHNLPPVNGREMTSQDVAYSIQRIATNKPDFRRRSHFEAVEKIETPDKNTVKLILKAPSAPLLNYLAEPRNVIVAKEVVDKFGDLKSTEAQIGTGPFIFKEHTKGVGGSATKNPNYFVKGKPYLDEVRWAIIPEPAARTAALRAGQIDSAYNMTKVDMDALKQAQPDLTVLEEPFLGPMHVLFQVDKPPFNDIRVRRAMSLAIDRQEIISAAYQGAGRISGPVPWGLKAWAIPEDELGKMPGYRLPKDQDIAEAKKLLADAGYAQGLKVSFELSEGYAFCNKWPGEVVVGQLRKAGIQADVKMMEIAAFLKSEGDRNYETRVRCLGFFNEPDEHLYSALHSTGSRNYANYKDPKVDQMLEKSRATVDVAERKQILLELQRYAIDQVARVWLVDPTFYSIARPHVKGLKSGIRLLWYQYSDVWVTK